MDLWPATGRHSGPPLDHRRLHLRLRPGGCHGRPDCGFRPQVVRDACADRTLTLHDSNLADPDAKYADVADLHEALAHLHE